MLTMAMGSAGCGNRQAMPNPADNRLQAQAYQRKAIDNPNNVAAHLESLARGVQGVKDATCVVFGKYAIVGINVDEKMERTRVGTIKYAVAEAFRKDPYGIDALVTADIDLAQRVREVRADVNNGRPFAGFAEELADIMGRLIPQIPRNIIPPKAPENMGTSSLDSSKNDKKPSGKPLGFAHGNNNSMVLASSRVISHLKFRNRG
ncbi:YhcN/YlaJ family sporulation lipoprotein [Cohnella cholangitidis]|uniref:YhcN/YlaJ family sporulation lipoprotein n=2 Tax=Cohnella cholangitidis TaxID=2598458 RepID=A0A7G5C6N2_9BACL|nr:YhcN/YlaJ family sporulation lipoprotein [Cohnella cholangitidis]